MSEQLRFRRRLLRHLLFVLLVVPTAFLIHDYLQTHRQVKSRPPAIRRIPLGSSVHPLRLLSDRNDRYLYAAIRSRGRYGLYVIDLKKDFGRVVQRIRLPRIHTMVLSADEKRLYLTTPARLYLFDSSHGTGLQLIDTYTLDPDSDIHPFKTRLLESPRYYYSTTGWTHTLSLSADKNTLYVAGPKGLYFFDAADLRHLRLLGSLHDKSYYNVRSLDATRILATAFRTAEVLDITDPVHPARISSLRLPFPHPNYLAAHGKRVFVSFGYNATVMHLTVDNRGGLHRLNDLLTDPARYIYGLFLADEGQALLVHSHKLYTFDIRYPLDPKRGAVFDCPGRKGAVEGSYYNPASRTLYLGCFDGTVTVITHPRFLKVPRS